MSKEYCIKDGESEKSYIYRVCECKDDIGNWNDVAKILNENLCTEYAPATYRKKYQTFREFYDEFRENMTASEELRQIEEAERRLQSERYKLQATKVELNRDMRHKARVELLYENIKDAFCQLPVPEPIPIPERRDSRKEYLLEISDLHYGAVFDSVNNSFSREECQRRMNVLLADVTDYIMCNKIAKMNVVNLGDTIQGILRLTDLQMNDIPVVEAVVEVSRMLANFLNELSAVCEVRYYHCSSANHTQTRPLNSKASELAAEDMEKIIINYIYDVLRNNKRVAVEKCENDGHIDIELCDFNVCCMHGHQIKSLESSLKDVSFLYGRNYDYLLIGHQHAAQTKVVGERDNHNLEVIVAPAIVGSCPYSDKLMKGSKSMACVYEFEKDYGHTCTKNFILN